VGSIARSERLAKYNRLLLLEHRHPELTFARGELDRFMR
jgi:enolase